MLIEVLGPGCPKCEKLAAAVAEAAAGLDVRVVKVTDIGKITARGVLMTPALIVDGEIKSVGKVLRPAEIRAMLCSPAGS